MRKIEYKKVSDLLTSDRRWCKNKLSGNGRYCLVGAINKVYTDHSKYTKIINKVAKQTVKLGYLYVANFNDDPKTTFKDVENLVKKLNI